MGLRTEFKSALDEIKSEAGEFFIDLTVLRLNSSSYDPDNPNFVDETSIAITGFETKFSWLERQSGKIEENDRRFLIDPDDYAAIKIDDAILLDGDRYEILRIEKTQQDVLYKLDIRG